MIQHNNLIWVQNLDHTFAPTFQDESQLPTFQVANCDVIGENSRTERICMIKTSSSGQYT